MRHIRTPAVAGTFYPRDKAQLAQQVQGFLSAASAGSSAVPKAIIVPHAGYIYSGAMAARGYSCLADARHTIHRVILLGPVHRVPIHGMALPGVDCFTTPLGEIQIDQAAADAIADLPQVIVSEAAHQMEHSLEVQLPFLQLALDDFTLLPLAVGTASADDVAQVINRLWGGKETLIVVSSDLSHYLPYLAAQKTDRQTVDEILKLQDGIKHEQACGGTPVNGLLLAARGHRLQAELLGLCNSGDTSGDKSRVVGYASFAFREAV